MPRIVRHSKRLEKLEKILTDGEFLESEKDMHAARAWTAYLLLMLKAAENYSADMNYSAGMTDNEKLKPTS